MTIPLETNHTPAWLERFRVEPKAALDAMLRGLSRVPPYRAAPPDILDRLFGGLPAGDPDLCLLDETLRLSEAWDLPRALAQAAALTQTDQRLRFYWRRLCKDAAPSLPAGYDRLGPEWPEQLTGHQEPWREP